MTSVLILVLMGQVGWAALEEQQLEAALAEEQLAAALVEQQLAAEEVSSNAARLADDSDFWAQPANAMARQIPTVVIMIFMGEILPVNRYRRSSGTAEGPAEARVIRVPSIAPEVVRAARKRDPRRIPGG